MEYRDFDLLIDALGDGTYRSQVSDSDAGQAQTIFSIPFSKVELEEFYRRIGHPRQARRNAESPLTAARLFGQRLFQATLTGGVYACFTESLARASAQGRGLRLRLRLNAPELNDLPWEFLYDENECGFLATFERTPVVRYTPLSRPAPLIEVTPPLKILTVIASPIDYRHLDVDGEWQRLNDALAGLQRRGLVQIGRLGSATPSGLQKCWRQNPAHVFHFIGHGGFDPASGVGSLVFEDQRHYSSLRSGQVVGTLLGDAAPRLAILNACEGARSDPHDPFAGVALSLVRVGVPAVVAMQFEISDTAAQVFAETFYEALAEGLGVDAALAQARKALFSQDENDIEWGTPVLFSRAPGGRILAVSEPTPSSRPLLTVVPDPVKEKYLRQLYTAALERDALEDWPAARDLWQQIVSESVDYQDAAQMLAKARQQCAWLEAYQQAQAAIGSEDWPQAVQFLEKLAAQNPTYRNTQALLVDARQQAELANLYRRMRLLAEDRKWSAVLRLADQRLALRKDAPDPDGLRQAAESALAAERQQAELEDMYTRALQARSAARWPEAYELLTHIQALQSGYRESTRLLAEARKHTRLAELYADAQRLSKEKQWSAVVAAFEQLKELNPAAPDPDGLLAIARQALIQQQAKAELARQAQAEQPLKAKPSRLPAWSRRLGGGIVLLGVLLLAVGAVWLAQSQGWFGGRPSQAQTATAQALALQAAEQATTQAALASVSTSTPHLTITPSLTATRTNTPSATQLVDTLTATRPTGTFTVTRPTSTLAATRPVDTSTATKPALTSTPNPQTATVAALQTAALDFSPQIIIDDFGVPMAFIPAGAFQMGSEDADDNETPVHTVTLSAFYLDVYEVTNARYKECVTAGECRKISNTGSYSRSSYSDNPKYADYPVIYVSWDDAVTYCEWRGGRLPTEAEWEKAARGGQDGKKYPWGDQASTCAEGAVNGADFYDCVGSDTFQVGSFAPNGYGLYDMAGNVWEWVNDWYGATYYRVSPADNPTGPVTGVSRIVRGGSWFERASDLRVSARNRYGPSYWYVDRGFRCARSP